MFIPRGKALHENLATSYVLVDALVADLCEGGFSGVVNIVLRDTDAHVVIARGKVAAVIERRNAPDWTGEPMAFPYLRTTVAELVATARRHRGRVSVYGYSADTASAVAGRINAEPLYTRLSTDFADLEKMISKLARERDRQWFVELTTGSGVAALIHIKDGRARILISKDGAPLDEHETADLIGSRELRELLDESNRAGGNFDVYFKAAGDPLESFDPTLSEHAKLESAIPFEKVAAAEEARQGGADEVSQAVREAKAVYNSLTLDDPAPGDALAADIIREGPGSQPGLGPQPQGGGPSGDPPPSDANGGAGARAADDLSLVQNELSNTGSLSPASEAAQMADIKRLMGEIAKAIEEAGQAVEQRDRFSMYLRAGQLKIADRYPFLDPFGAEFEYLAGEIVFVGKASPGDFIAGLTEALSRAVQGVTESSSQAARLRARIAEGLQWVLKSQRAELEQYNLDQSIEQIIGIVTPGS
ncbi:MAG: hypothetical protein ACLGJB_18180 [Blastocatellia bacterium]